MQFEVGQIIYVRNADCSMAWPAFIQSIAEVDKYKIIFSTGECSTLESRYLASWPPLTADLVDKTIQPIDEKFFEGTDSTTTQAEESSSTEFETDIPAPELSTSLLTDSDDKKHQQQQQPGSLRRAKARVKRHLPKRKFKRLGQPIKPAKSKCCTIL